MLTEYFSFSCLRDTTRSLQRSFLFFLKKLKLCDVVGFSFQQQVESQTSKTVGMHVNGTRGQCSPCTWSQNLNVLWVRANPILNDPAKHTFKRGWNLLPVGPHSQPSHNKARSELQSGSPEIVYVVAYCAVSGMGSLAFLSLLVLACKTIIIFMCSLCLPKLMCQSALK